MDRSSSKLELAARTGYAAKGIVYILVGVLAVRAAFGSGGKTAGGQGALESLIDEPFGKWMLGAVAIGLVLYAIYRLMQAIFDVSNEGSDAKGVIRRIAFGVSAFTYGALAWWAFQTVRGGGSGSAGGSGGGGGSGWTADLMAQPFGVWLVGIAGVIVIGVGLRQFQRAWKASFMKKYAPEEMEPETRRLAKRIGQVGLAARGVTFLMIGTFIIQAARQHDPSESGGLGKAFDTLLQQPYGPWLLGLVAIGFVCYGIYCFSYVRYRRFDDV